MQNNYLIITIFAISSSFSYAKDLVDIIPSLYGGDGVQLSTATTGFNHAPHFEGEALRELNELTRVVSEIQFPYPNASRGITFSYDPVLDDFVKSLEDNSLLFTDPAKTLGKGRFSAGITYSNISFDKINGRNVDSLSLALNHSDLGEPGSDICIGGPMPTCYLFEDDNVILDIDMQFDSEIIFLFGAMGLSDHLDVTFVLPIVKNHISILSQAYIRENETKQFFPGTLHEFDVNGINGDNSRSHAKETKIGFGDIQINGKWNFYSSSDLYLSTQLEFLIPTGDADNFMGSDTLSVTPSFLLSTQSGIAGIPINAHFNLGYEFSTGKANNQLSYATALDYRFEFNDSVLTTAFEILGQHNLETRTGFADDQLDAAVGTKWNFWDKHSIFFNYRFPFNDDGLRSSHMFSVGYAATF